MTQHRHHRHHKHHRYKNFREKMLKAPKPHDVNKFLWAVIHKKEKRGSRYYKKRRSKMERTIHNLLKHYHLAYKGNENYWKLKASCILLGKEIAWL